MAAVTVTWTVGTNAGAGLRKLAKQIERAASDVPDLNPTGASTVLTITSTDSPGLASVQITAGPITSAKYYI